MSVALRTVVYQLLLYKHDTLLLLFFLDLSLYDAVGERGAKCA
jgi:hypothetical protein